MLTNIKTGLKYLRFLPAISCMPSTIRFFSPSGNPPKKQTAVQKPTISSELSQALRNELKFEKERYVEFTEGNDFIKQSGFTLIESPENAEIKLVKNVGDKNVEIRYQASELIDDAEEGERPEEEKMDAKNGEEEKEGDAKSRSEFTVTVKGKDGKGLLFACASENAEMNIFSISYSNNVDGLFKDDYDKTKTPYLGPTFDNLDEKVQRSFYEYLESLGINEKLLAYIECTSVDKEQKMYINWLQDISKFVEGSK